MLVQHVRALGATIPDDLLAHVAPLGWEHIALTGDYVWTDSNAVARLRPLRDVPAAFLSAGGLACSFEQIVWRPHFTPSRSNPDATAHGYSATSERGHTSASTGR